MTGEGPYASSASAEPVTRTQDGFSVRASLRRSEDAGDYTCYACPRVGTALVDYEVWRAVERPGVDEPSAIGTAAACHTHEDVAGVRSRALRRLMLGPCDDEWPWGDGDPLARQERAERRGGLAADS